MQNQSWTAEEAAVYTGMGLAVVRLRGTRQMSQADLAREAGVDPSTLRAIERGECDARWGTLRKVASALKTPLEAMMEMAEELAPGVGRAARREQGSDRE
ncbi:MAG TPA: helix-turn-helix transcriptional regulator [Terrimicrobiaceae bacterium]|nr:helix-turn-helix transcriptional regulator [Terrimicrobiaceae bacterium]